MPLSKMLQGPRSIKFFSMLFLMSAFIIFLSISAVSFYSIQRVSQQLEVVKTRAAYQELSNTLTILTGRLSASLEELASWDETFQQLGNPIYYPYWKEHRLLSNPKLPAHLIDVDLYDRQGSILAKYEGQKMPQQLTDSTMSMDQDFRLSPDGHLVAFTAIREVGGEGSLLGYLGFQVDFLPLLNEQVLNFIQPKTLALGTFTDVISIQESIQYLEFELPENLDLQVLVNVVRKTLIFLVLGVLILSVAFYWAATRLIERPIQHLVRHIHSLQDSSRDGNISLSQPLILSELDEVRESLNEYQLRLSQVHQNLDQKNQELWDLAFHDSLTGCYNRRAFDEHWNGLLSSLPSSRLNVSMILFDCNHFKALNDTYGHQVGDFVLQAISESILKSLRSGDNLYRIGGDEFVLILLDADLAAAEHLAQRCIEYVGQYDFYQFGIDEPVRVSVGISSTVSDNRDSLVNLHWQADIAMYHAKRPGNRHIMHYTAEMSSESGSVLSNRIIVAVHQAITNGDNLVMYYQPIVNLNDDRVEYYEALVRIRDGAEIISPTDIFQIVESRRLEQEFDLAVFGCIHKDLASGKLPEGTGISINVSGPSIIDERVVEWLDPFVPYIGRYKLQVEVTETSLIRQLHKAGSVLNRLRDKGFIVALDDFGSGYSSLRYLASMPVDLVKFDITLIRGLEENSQQRTVIEGLAEVIMHAGFPLVAEGIEHIQMLDRVRDLGFCYAQGYLVGRPASCEELF